MCEYTSIFDFIRLFIPRGGSWPYYLWPQVRYDCDFFYYRDMVLAVIALAAVLYWGWPDRDDDRSI